MGFGSNLMRLPTPHGYIYTGRLEYLVDGVAHPIEGEFELPRPIEERRILDIVYRHDAPSVWDYADDRLPSDEQEHEADRATKVIWMWIVAVPMVLGGAVVIGLYQAGYSFADMREYMSNMFG